MARCFIYAEYLSPRRVRQVMNNPRGHNISRLVWGGIRNYLPQMRKRHLSWISMILGAEGYLFSMEAKYQVSVL